MTTIHARSKRKKAGGKYHSMRSKKKRELGRQQIEVRVGETKRKTVKTRGGNKKVRAINLNEANVLDPKTKKYAKSEIMSVVKNPANPHYVRRNTINKGAVIKTKAGEARVTNRPGQEGFINAVLVEEKK